MEIISQKQINPVGVVVDVDKVQKGIELETPVKASVEADLKAVKDILERTKDQEMSDNDIDKIGRAHV